MQDLRIFNPELILLVKENGTERLQLCWLCRVDNRSENGIVRALELLGPTDLTRAQTFCIQELTGARTPYLQSFK